MCDAGLKRLRPYSRSQGKQANGAVTPGYQPSLKGDHYAGLCLDAADIGYEGKVAGPRPAGIVTLI